MMCLVLLLIAVPGLMILWLWSERGKNTERDVKRRACFEFDLSLAARRYQQRSGLSGAETASVEQEFRRFFLLLAENPGSIFGLHNGPIDDFWHELICCTALYRAFCQRVAGRFIDHDPEGGSGDGYADSWWAYHDRFLEAPPALYWPTPEPPERPAPRRTDNGYVISGCSGGSDGGSHGGGCCGGGHGCGGGSGCGGH